MKQQEIGPKVHSAMYQQCKRRGYAAPVDVLMDIGVLSKKQYEDWRNGRVQYLEAVCSVNLHQLSAIMREMRVYAKDHDLKPSFCYYKQWGTKKNPASASRLFRYASVKPGNLKSREVMQLTSWTAEELRN
jgi:hypothetical protein